MARQVYKHERHTVKKRTAIGNSLRSRPKNKHKRRQKGLR